METPKVAIKRGEMSTPTKWLWQHGHLRGLVLDYGCGHGDDCAALGIDGYDPNYGPSMPRLSRYDTIICQYVLCVLENEADRQQVMDTVFELLNRGGCAYFTVRRDISPTSRTEGQRTWWVTTDLPVLHVEAGKYIIYEMRRQW